MSPALDRPVVDRAIWHALAFEDVIARLQTDGRGLTNDEARARLRVAGPNSMPAPQRASRWRVLADQLRSVIVLLLLLAAVLAALTGGFADAAAIGAVLAVNVLIGYVMEIGAHRAVEALGRLESRQATVVRDGVPQEIDARDVVPGDLLLIEAGQTVPADARLTEATELRVVESLLTGESMPAVKADDVSIDGTVPVPDRKNMVYLGTTVVAGTGRAIVTCTGAATELGRLGTLVNATPVERTPLERRLDSLGRQLVWLALAVGGVTGLLALWQQLPLGVLLQTAVALAVAAVPEGLPAVATIALALGVRRMARRNAVVRRLPSVETLGSVTVICTDKTGTLTAASMVATRLRTIPRVIDVTGHGYEPVGSFIADGRAIAPADDEDLMMLLRIVATVSRGDAVLSSSGWTARGDPTEAALAVAARKAGIERIDIIHQLPEIGEVPFSSRRSFMATFHRSEDGVLAFVKGAPQIVFERCATVLERGVVRPMRAADRLALLDANHAMSEDGLRVLAAAYGLVNSAAETELTNLTLVGLAGMSDPPAEGVQEAIRTFQAAGVRTVMVTGDQSGTALALARTLGLAADHAVVEGAEIERLSNEALAKRLENTAVFSRVSPESKLRIVSGFQRRGDVVAMLGDGVNDAAALKKADIGVTMGGRGTDVAREAAAIVLKDDRFGTIGAAIEEGRVAYDNIRKFVFYLFSCNLAEILVLLGAGVAGMPPPLLPIQILWLNLVTDTVPALALAAEPGGPDIMRRPPRNPHADILSLLSGWTIAFYAILIAAPVFFAMWWSAVLALPRERAMTISFMVLSFAQLLHVGNARDDRAVLHPRRAFANLPALIGVVLTLALQIGTVLSPPLRSFLHLGLLAWDDWLLVAALSAIPALVGQGVKLARANFSPIWAGNISRTQGK